MFCESMTLFLLIAVESSTFYNGKVWIAKRKKLTKHLFYEIKLQKKVFE